MGLTEIKTKAFQKATVHTTIPFLIFLQRSKPVISVGIRLQMTGRIVPTKTNGNEFGEVVLFYFFLFLLCCRNMWQEDSNLIFGIGVMPDWYVMCLVLLCGLVRHVPSPSVLNY